MSISHLGNTVANLHATHRTPLPTEVSAPPFIHTYHQTNIEFNHDISNTYTMPPLAPTPISASNTRTSLRQAVKLTTLRTNTWLAIETLIEFVVVFYLIWTLFYLMYLCTCGAMWTVKKLRDFERGRKWVKVWTRDQRMQQTRKHTTAASERQPALVFQQLCKDSVEHGNAQETLKDTGTYGYETGRGRRMTL